MYFLQWSVISLISILVSYSSSDRCSVYRFDPKCLKKKFFVQVAVIFQPYVFMCQFFELTLDLFDEETYSKSGKLNALVRINVFLCRQVRCMFQWVNSSSVRFLHISKLTTSWSLTRIRCFQIHL